MLNVVEFVSWVTPRLQQLRVTDSELALGGGSHGDHGLGFDWEEWPWISGMLQPRSTGKEEEEERWDESVVFLWLMEQALPKKGQNCPKHNNLPCFGGAVAVRGGDGDLEEHGVGMSPSGVGLFPPFGIPFSPRTSGL